jgi:peptidoglycan DL-endopeptidase CwlO
LELVRPIVGRPAGVFLIVAMLISSFVVPQSTAVAAPTNAKIRAKQSEAAKADVKLQALADDLELKQTDLQAVEEALNGTRDDIAVTEARLADAQAKLDESHARLAERAEAIYRNGSVNLLDVLVGVSDFNDFVSRIDMLDRIETADADLVAQVSADRDRVDQARTALLNRETEQVALRQEAEVRSAEVQASFTRQKAYVASLSAQIKQLVKAEELRREKAAAEAARRAAAASSNHPDGRSSDAGSLGSPHPDAAREAAKYLGVPYVWGGTTPHGFDCSGLVQYSYRQIGISIPRTSRDQFTIGQFIPRSRKDLLEPGDLVFFGYDGDASRIHHVGMYVGGGTFIHAPSSGDHVKYSSLSSRGDYVGAVRP